MRLDPPLVPDGDQARAELRRELLAPQYHHSDSGQQVLDWLQRHLQGGVDAANGAPALSTLAAMLVLVALLAAVGLLLSRARRTPRAASTARAVLTAELVTAAELHARAVEALAAGRFAEVVVDGFRSLTLHQVERGRLEDSPGATAHEVSSALGASLPAHADQVARVAGRFDAVLYGGQPATPEEALEVLRLADALAGRQRSRAR